MRNHHLEGIVSCQRNIKGKQHREKSSSKVPVRAKTDMWNALIQLSLINSRLSFSSVSTRWWKAPCREEETQLNNFAVTVVTLTNVDQRETRSFSDKSEPLQSYSSLRGGLWTEVRCTNKTKENRRSTEVSEYLQCGNDLQEMSH